MEERRRYQRTYVQRHAGEYDYALEIDGKYYYASIVDISSGGARFSIKDAPDYDMKGYYGAVKNDYYDAQYLLNRDYKVVWNYKDYIGVEFNDALEKEYDDLNYYYATYA